MKNDKPKTIIDKKFREPVMQFWEPFENWFKAQLDNFSLAVEKLQGPIFDQPLEQVH